MCSITGADFRFIKEATNHKLCPVFTTDKKNLFGVTEWDSIKEIELKVLTHKL